MIENSAFVAAPLVGLTLARLGAEVIRCDPPGGSLDYRRWPLAPDGASLFWEGLNRGKRSVSIDVRRAEGQELLAALVCVPGTNNGVYVTNLPNTEHLSYQALRSRRNDVVVLEIVGREDGSSAVDYTIAPTTGVPDLTGPEDSCEPVSSPVPHWDVASGLTAAVTLLAATQHRMLTGQGEHVTVALSEVAISTLSSLGMIAEAQLSPTERKRSGNHIYGAFGRDFQTSDSRRIFIAAITSKQWRSLLDATGLHDRVAALAASARVDFDDAGRRFEHRDELSELVGAWCLRHTLDQVADAFAGSGVCWSTYQTVRELAANDAAMAPERPLVTEVSEHGRRHRIAGFGVALNGGERRPLGSVPRPGGDTEEVLTSRLGLAQKELSGLVSRGVVVFG